MDIGNRIKECRMNCNLSQEDLALKIFVSRQTISNWENNKFYPDIKSIALLCNIFDVSLDDFIEGDLDQMKKVIEESEKKKFLVLGWIYTIELLVMVVSAYPMFKFFSYIGIVIWLLFVVITLSTSFAIEKIKKKYDIQTYKEIIAFYENKTLTRDDKNKEIGKRFYQKVFLTLICAFIAFNVMLIMIMLIG